MAEYLIYFWDEKGVGFYIDMPYVLMAWCLINHKLKLYLKVALVFEFPLSFHVNIMAAS
jgi:hypothetical protein